MASVTIGQTTLPAPSKYTPSRFDIDAEGTKRNEQGYLQRYRVRQGLYRIELEWAAITSAEADIVDVATTPATFSVTFDAPAGSTTKTMYVGDRQFERVKHGKMATETRWDVSLALIEV